jgi:hypothetical protein
LRLFPRDLPRLTVDPKHEFVFPLTSIGSPMAWSTKGARGSAVSRRNFELKTGAVVVCARNERSTGCWCIERTDAVSRPRGSVPRGKSVCLTWRNAGEAEIADFSRWWLAESRPVRVQPLRGVSTCSAWQSFPSTSARAEVLACLDEGAGLAVRLCDALVRSAVLRFGLGAREHPADRYFRACTRAGGRTVSATPVHRSRV